MSPPLMEVDVSERFTGDLDGESTVRALELKRENQSASLVSMRRFCEKLGGRKGAFVLQGSASVENGKIRLVVHESGTGDLSGLAAKVALKCEFGRQKAKVAPGKRRTTSR